MRLSSTVAGGAIIGVIGVANADQIFQVDIDALSAASATPFSSDYSGNFSVFSTGDDGDARILDVLVNGTAQNTGGADLSGFFFEMNITFDSGKIASGDITLRVDGSGSENIYTATILAADAPAIQDVGGLGILYNISGLTFEGMFSDAAGTFLGVDIGTWGSVQPVSGFFTDIAFRPDSSNTDADSDVDVFVMVPLPSSAWLAGLGLMGLIACRRR